MVVSATGLELVAMGDKSVGESPGVGDDLLSIGLPLRSRDLEEGGSNGSDGLREDTSVKARRTLDLNGTHVVVGTTLTSGEDSIVDALLEVRSIGVILPEEDETSTGTTEGLVGGSSNNIAILEGVVQLLGSDETRSVGNVGHEPSTLLVSDLTELSIVPVTGVSRSTADDETGLENFGLGGKASIVYEVGVGGNRVGVGLEVDGRRSHLLLCSLKTACEGQQLKKKIGAP